MFILIKNLTFWIYGCFFHRTFLCFNGWVTILVICLMAQISMWTERCGLSWFCLMDKNLIICIFYVAKFLNWYFRCKHFNNGKRFFQPSWVGRKKGKWKQKLSCGKLTSPLQPGLLFSCPCEFFLVGRKQVF